MAGAGTSISRYGSWLSLLEHLGEIASKHGHDFGIDETKMAAVPLAYAEDARAALRAAGEEARYFDFLRRTFGPRDDQFGELHELLVTLPFCGLMTTNYDPCFVAAIAKVSPGSFDAWRVLRGGSPGGVNDWVRSLNGPSAGPRLVMHCHGYHLIPDTIVLAATDYKELYGELPPLDVDAGQGFGRIQTNSTIEAEILRGVFTHRPVVFVGFSLVDPYFRAFIEFVMRALWRFDSALSTTVVVLADTEAEAAQQLRDRLGLRVLLYDPVNEQHDGLLELLRRIHARCGRPVPASMEPGAHEPWWLHAFQAARLRVQPQ